MKKSSLNRKFGRALAASLGAIAFAFASTSCVINAVDQKLIKQREVARFLANVGGDMDTLNLHTENKDLAKHALGLIDIGGGQLLGCLVGFEEEIKANRDYKIKITVNGIDIDLPVRLKRDIIQNPGKEYRICPDINNDLGTTHKMVDIDQKIGYNRWTRSRWNDLYRSLERKIKKLEKAEADAAAKRAEDARRAEENARAERERERANSLFSSSGNQTVTAPINNNAAMTAATLAATTMIPMTTMMNNTTPVHTTTPSLVNTGNTMGTQMGTNADMNNTTNSQINHNANVVEGKTKT